MDVMIKDDSYSTAALALQGPNSRAILNAVSSKSLDSLKFFWMIDTTFENIPVNLITAVPSIETFDNIKKGKFTSSKIQERYKKWRRS